MKELIQNTKHRLLLILIFVNSVCFGQMFRVFVKAVFIFIRDSFFTAEGTERNTTRRSQRIQKKSLITNLPFLVIKNLYFSAPSALYSSLRSLRLNALEKKSNHVSNQLAQRTKPGIFFFLIFINSWCFGQNLESFVAKFPVKTYPLVFDTSIASMVKQNKKLSKDEVYNILIPAYTKNRGIEEIGFLEYLVNFPNRYVDNNEFSELVNSGKQLDGSFDFIPLCKVTDQKISKLYLLEVSFFIEGNSYQIISMDLSGNQLNKIHSITNSYNSLFPYFNYQFCKLNLDSNIIISYTADTSYYIIQHKDKADSTIVIINQVFQDEKSSEMLYFDFKFDGPKIYYTSKKSKTVMPLTLLEFSGNTYKVTFPADKVIYTLKMIKNNGYSYRIECSNNTGFKQIFNETSPMIPMNEELGILTDRFSPLRGLYNYINFEIN